jgi:glycine betaine/L-proline ABC transporter, permease/glycine betaine/L-proline-binding protein
MKTEFAEQHPDIVNSLDKLAGKISKIEMIEINYRESRRRKTDGRSTGLFKEKRLDNRAGNNI